MTSTETKTATETTAPVTNLRQTRKEQAAKKAPAAKATLAKKATPTPAAKAPTAPAARKLRWVVEGDRNAKGGKNQSAVVGDHAYAITGAGEGWTATVTVDGKATPLVTEGKFSAAYTACVEHNRERA